MTTTASAPSAPSLHAKIKVRQIRQMLRSIFPAAARCFIPEGERAKWSSTLLLLLLRRRRQTVAGAGSCSGSRCPSSLVERGGQMRRPRRRRRPREDVGWRKLRGARGARVRDGAVGGGEVELGRGTWGLGVLRRRGVEVPDGPSREDQRLQSPEKCLFIYISSFA